jgi:hypothetical protein
MDGNQQIDISPGPAAQSALRTRPITAMMDLAAARRLAQPWRRNPATALSVTH